MRSERKNARHKRRLGRAGIILMLMGGLLLGPAVPGARAADPAKTREGAVQKQASKRRETRNTLSPLLFTGKTAVTYKIARKIPDVLDGLYCYCRCKENPALKHKSLLSCYVDRHAAYCDICQNEALMAYNLHLKGKSVREIMDAIDARYGKRPAARNK